MSPEDELVPAVDVPETSPTVGARLFSDIGILAAGVPETPAAVWTETFEQGLTTTTPSSVSSYAGNRFTASNGWSTGTNCTGVLVNYTATFPNTSFCPSEPILIGIGGNNTSGARETRRMADVLGQVAAGATGGTSTTPTAASTATTRVNHALTAAPYTTIPANNTIVLQSAAGTGVVAANSRYYTLRVDAVGAECGTNNASLTFALLSGTTTFSPFPAAVVPCADGGYYTSTPTLVAPGGILDPALPTSARASTYTGSSPVLLTPAQILAAQLRITNSGTSALGNAFGVDNLRVLDVSPALDAEFSPAPATSTVPTTLTYTITNRSDLLAKSDWSFSAALPAGLVVAPAPTVGGTCVNVTGTAFAVTAAAGSASIAVVGGDLAANTTSCTISVNVLAAGAGTYTSGAITSSGLIASPATSLTVLPASTLTVRKNIVARGSAGDQFTLSVRSGTAVLGTATTTGAATGLQAAQAGPVVVQPGTAYTIHEAPTTGAGLGYATTYECVRGTTVIAAGTSPAGAITMPTDQGAAVVCTFTNAPQTTRLACDVNHYYGVSATGALAQADAVAGTTASVGTWTATSANALGVGLNGSLAYAIDRSTDGTAVGSVLKWTPANGFQTLANTGYTTVAGGATIGGAIVAGTVDPSGTRFLFGKFTNSQFYVWSFTESNPAASRYAFVGSFPAGASPNGNGDMAFDARGNLYVVGASTTNNVSSAAIFTVTAETLAAANGTTLAVNTSTTKALSNLDGTPAFGNVNGIAFSPEGSVYLSGQSSAYEFDATTWRRLDGTPRVTIDATDLGGCSSPATVTVLKNVVGRAAAADQFVTTLSNGGTVVATATTTGAATGRQAAQIGPVPVPIGTALTLSEAMDAASASQITAYTPVYECWADGVRLATGAAATGAVTMPNRLSVNVVCTFFNSPRPASTVTLTKQVLDPATGTAQPASGWTLGVTGTATVGTASVLPGENPQQITAANGTAVWTVLFGSLASRATLVVSEVQQAGFVFVSGACTVNGAAATTTFTTVGNVVSASLPGIASASTVACTIINRAAASLTLVKRVDLGSAPITDWTLTATAPAGALPGPSGRSGTAATTAVTVSPAVAYRLSEVGGALTYVQSSPWQCVTAGGQTVAVTAAGDVTLAQGSVVTCTVTNATARLTLLKTVISPQTGFQAPNWTLTATPAAITGGTLPTQSRVGAEYSAGGNAASTFDVRPGHSYTLSEAVTQAGSRLSYQQLRLERLDGSTWVTVPSLTIAAPAAGQSAIYRFVNAPVVPPRLPLTGGTSTDIFLYGGGAVLTLALVLAAWHRRRRERGDPF